MRFYHPITVFIYKISNKCVYFQYQYCFLTRKRQKMKIVASPKKIISIFALVLSMSAACFSQVKVGNNATIINPNAIFEIESADKGFLLPRLALRATTNPFPLSAFVEGMLVYDTATIGDITPGLYYCDGTKWIRSSSGSSNTAPENAWKLTGNNSTQPGTNFIGTTDDKDLVFKTNGIERLRLTKEGWLGIGEANPKAALHIKGQVMIDSVEAGNIASDSLLVISPIDGKIKAVSPSNLMSGVRKATRIIAATGQINFTTPATITDPDRVSLYRNGILINFTVTGTNTITAEIAAVMGDEIKIIQIL
jgi:hypothetical protein